MSTSSYDVPRSAQTRSTTTRASSQRWQPGLEYNRTRVLLIGRSFQQPQGASALSRPQPPLLHLAGDGVGELVDDVDHRGPLEPRQASEALLLHQRRHQVAVGARAYLDVGDHGLPGAL